jgi:putative inorganic carbon (hco3(-)) transporter
MTNGFRIYIIFLISWFLHIGSRIPALGLIRFDMLLVALLAVLAYMESNRQALAYEKTSTDKLLKYMIVYILATIPFVQWPGSVINVGLQNFVKAIVFYYFTVIFVSSEERLRTFMLFFLLCQSFRIMEPVYLHLTQGYWGEAAYASGEFIDRLAGAPNDTIGANGLAFVIVSCIPFFYFLAPLSFRNKVLFFSTTPLFLYALVLTGSRSGFVGLLAVLFGFVLKSKKKMILIIIFFALGFMIFVNLSPDQQDRYLSIFSSNTKNSATAEGRTEGVLEDFNVALNRPFFGHGIGTSREANFHFRGIDQLSHNLYTEIAQELGFVGLAMFLLYMYSVIQNFIFVSKRLRNNYKTKIFYLSINNSMQVWFGMTMLFSFASYGLSSYEWYLFPGLSVAMKRLTENVDDFDA